MEIVVNSRQTKASDVIDWAFDVGLDRPKIVTVEEWDGSPAYIVTFGPPAYRKTINPPIRPWMTKEQVEQVMAEAKAEAESPKWSESQIEALKAREIAPLPINRIEPARVRSKLSRDGLKADQPYTYEELSGEAGLSKALAKPQKRKAAKSRV